MRHTLERPLGHHRGDRVADHGEHHLRHRHAVPGAQPGPGEHQDAAESHGEAGPARGCHRQPVAGHAADDHGQDRHGRDEQPDRRARQGLLGGGEHQPRPDHLEQREQRDGRPPARQRAEAPAPQREREQHGSADRGAREHDRGGADPCLHGDLDEQVGRAPHDAEQTEEQPPAPAHAVGSASLARCRLSRTHPPVVGGKHRTSRPTSGPRHGVIPTVTGRDPLSPERSSAGDGARRDGPGPTGHASLAPV